MTGHEATVALRPVRVLDKRLFDKIQELWATEAGHVAHWGHFGDARNYVDLCDYMLSIGKGNDAIFELERRLTDEIESVTNDEIMSLLPFVKSFLEEFKANNPRSAKQ